MANLTFYSFDLFTFSWQILKKETFFDKLYTYLTFSSINIWLFDKKIFTFANK